MTSLSDDNKADIIVLLRHLTQTLDIYIYLDDLLNIDNPYFEGMVNQNLPLNCN